MRFSSRLVTGSKFWLFSFVEGLLALQVNTLMFQLGTPWLHARHDSPHFLRFINWPNNFFMTTTIGPIMAAQLWR